MNVLHGTRTARNGSRSRRTTATLAWSGPAALAVAGVLFVLYPAIRPFSDEGSLDGAGAFASASWLVAHSLAVAAFVLLSLGLLGLHLRLKDTPVGHRSLRALVLSWVGVGLTLPYYGAETFGLAAIGQEALDRNDATLVPLAEAVRYGPGIGFLVVGLLLLAAGAILLATAMWSSGDHLRWSGVPLAVGVVLYLPQFPTPQPVRVVHGVVMAIGCLLLARTLATRPPGTASEPARSTDTAPAGSPR